MVQKLFSFSLIATGLILILFPFFSGKDAYFAKDDFYLNQVDSVNIKYAPYLKKLATRHFTRIGNEEKLVYVTEVKKTFDSLEVAMINYRAKGKGLLVNQTVEFKENLRKEVEAKQLDIDDKYTFANLNEQKQNKIIKNVKDTLNKEKFLVILANEMYNPTKNKAIPTLTQKDIQIKKINLQDKKPFLISGLILIVAGIIFVLYLFGTIPLHNITVKTAVSFVLLLLILVMGYSSYSLINNRLAFEKNLDHRSNFVKKHLGKLRKVQLAYLEEKGNYCGSWDSLVLFTKYDSVDIVKYLVNKDDTVAVNAAKRNNLPLEEIITVAVVDKIFDGKAPFKIDSMAYVPFSDKLFELKVGSLDRNGRDIKVFEIKTNMYTFIENLPYVPENFDKTKKLILGSMTEPTTEGNW